MIVARKLTPYLFLYCRDEAVRTQIGVAKIGSVSLFLTGIIIVLFSVLLVSRARRWLMPAQDFISDIQKPKLA